MVVDAAGSPAQPGRESQRGNPVRCRDCPAAVCENDRRQTHWDHTWEATISRHLRQVPRRLARERAKASSRVRRPASASPSHFDTRDVRMNSSTTDPTHSPQDRQITADQIRVVKRDTPSHRTTGTRSPARSRMPAEGSTIRSPDPPRSSPSWRSRCSTRSPASSWTRR